MTKYLQTGSFSEGTGGNTSEEDWERNFGKRKPLTCACGGRAFEFTAEGYRCKRCHEIVEATSG